MKPRHGRRRKAHAAAALQLQDHRQLEQSAEHAAHRRQQIAKDYGRHRYDCRSNVPLN